MVKHIAKIVLGDEMYYVKDTEARNALIDLSEKGVAGGVATLDNSGKIPSSQLPESYESVSKLTVGETEYNPTDGNITIPAYPTTLPASDVSTWAKSDTKPSYTKSEIGLGNVTNDAQVKRSEMGTASGVATLDSAGKVPSSQLPSYVDDVLEYDSRSGFPATGEGGKIYVDKSNNTTWRWSGSAYSQIKGDLVIGTTSGTAADGGTANSHYNNTSNPHNVTKAQVGLGNVANTGDSATPVSGGTTKFTTGGAYTELNKKVDKVSGKGLSTNDYTTDEKNKLAGIAAGAEVNVQSDWNATSGDAFIKNKPTIPDSFLWFGTSSTAAATAQKEVSIPSITSLKTGQIIVVKPTVTSSVANSTLKLNSFDAYPMRYNNAAITTGTDSIVWAANIPSLFVFDGSYWEFLGRGLDSNTTYSAMSVAEGTAGTATSVRTMRADYLKQIIQAWAPQSDWNATSGNAVILNKPTIPSEVTESTVSGWGFTKNAGTITGIKMNGSSKGTSGVVDLGTVITAHQDISGKVDKTTTVNGHALSGNVSVTKSDVGLGNVGNFKAVSTVASQGLSDTEKTNARANIGAGTSSFSGNYNDLSNKPTIPAAAANGTYTVKTLVGSTTTNVSDFTANQSSADDVTFVQGSNVTITPDATNRKITIAATDTTYSSKAAASEGTAESLCTTGEKYVWNSKLSASNFTNNNKGTSVDKIMVSDSSNGLGYTSAANLAAVLGGQGDCLKVQKESIVIGTTMVKFNSNIILFVAIGKGCGIAYLKQNNDVQLVTLDGSLSNFTIGCSSDQMITMKSSSNVLCVLYRFN